ncbi:MAG: hypothetical protein GF344_11625 [Chitinivibrionales bacterium]|nr:hypothetical protein [Chitinivibrionales bacterium]
MHVFTKLLMCLLFLVSCSFADNCDKLRDSLFLSSETHVNAEYYIERIRSHCQEKAVKILSTYVEANLEFRDYVLDDLLEMNWTGLPSWLQKNASVLSKREWLRLKLEFMKKERVANDTIIADVFLSVALNHDTTKIRGILHHAFMENGAYREVIRIGKAIQNGDTLGTYDVMLVSQLRFNDSLLNVNVKEFLHNYPLTHHDFDAIVYYGFRFYSRYDFLPDLYALKARLLKQSDPRKIAEVEEKLKEVEEMIPDDYQPYLSVAKTQKIKDVEQMLEKLDEIIPILEKKKKQNAPIGLPLDWGMGDGD